MEHADGTYEPRNFYVRYTKEKRGRALDRRGDVPSFGNAHATKRVCARVCCFAELEYICSCVCTFVQVHESLRTDNYGEPWGEGDVIGFLIKLKSNEEMT